MKNESKNVLIVIDVESFEREYLPHRQYLLNMLKNFTLKLKFKSQTYFLAVKYLDLVMEKVTLNQIIGTDLEIIAISCLLLAGNYKIKLPQLNLTKTILTYQN